MMPCYDSRNEPEYVREEARAEFRHNSDVAEMLCELCHWFEKRGHRLPRKTRAWFDEHKARDAKKAP